MSQAIEEISHFRKCLGNSGNALAIEEFPELPRHLQKFQAFPEMPRQLQKFLIFCALFDTLTILGKNKTSTSSKFKTNLS
jgi:hypothetical protein